jgi:hypothetical protein
MQLDFKKQLAQALAGIPTGTAEVLEASIENYFGRVFASSERETSD